MRSASKEESVGPPNHLKVGDRGEKSQCRLRPQRMMLLLEEEEVVRKEGLALGITASSV